MGTMAIVNTEPTSITAGDSVAWTRSLSDYPASAGWSLSYTLINAAAKITINASAAGDDHAVSVSAATSSVWTAGDYTWQGAVTKGSERYTVGSGSLTIEKSFAAQTTLDTRSTARTMLEALEACYLAYLTNGQGHVAEYDIAGRRMKFRNAAEIWQQIEKLKREVAAEDRAARIAAGLPSRRRVLVRFGA